MTVSAATADETFSYTDVVQEVQAKVDADFGAGRILVVDMSADITTEIRRLMDAQPEGAVPYARVDTCFVLGAEPGLTVEEFFSRHGRTMNHGDISTEDVHKWALYREIGQCFDISKTAQVEMFAAFMTAPNSDSMDLLPMMAGL